MNSTKQNYYKYWMANRNMNKDKTIKELIMTDEDLNIRFICGEILLDKYDELVPIILDMLQDSYKAGLWQAKYDNTIDIIEENHKLKEVIDKVIEYCNNNKEFTPRLEDIIDILKR